MDNKKHDKNLKQIIGAIIVNLDTNEVELKPKMDKYFDGLKSVIQEKIVPNKQNDLHAEINVITKNTEGVVIKYSVADFLRGTPYEVVKGFTPKSICASEQFNATTANEAITKNIKNKSTNYR